MFRPKS